MISINGTTYKLLLVDTNIISEAIKNKNQEMRRLLEWTSAEKFIICFSVFTILELRKVPILYKNFLDIFSVIPCIILKSHEQLLQDEVSKYPETKDINPINVGFAGMLAKANLKETLKMAFENDQIARDEKKWVSNRESIVEGIEELVKNFPPDNGKYSREKIREFIELAGFQQLALRQKDFVKSFIDSGGAIDIDAFPSIKITAFTVFYKFYIDQRSSKISDAFDILIFSSIPYVDAVITESHFVDAIKKIKSQDDFIKEIEAYTIKQLRD